MAGAALLCVTAGTRLLAGAIEPPPSWAYVAAGLGCAHAAALGAITVAAGRRTTAAAWAPALLWPLAGPGPEAAALAALAGAVVLGSRLRVRGRALATVLGVGALAVLVGSASATPTAATRAAAEANGPDAGDETEDAGKDGKDAVGGRDAGKDAAGGTDATGGKDAAGGKDATGGKDAAGGTDAAGGKDDPDGGGDAAAGPAATVRAYYRALDARRFDAAWRTLSPGVRASFGGMDAWRAGFATTRTSRPDGLQVAAAGDRATVQHALTATDATACGIAVRRFALTWTLVREPRGAWRATAVTGRLLSGGLPVCP